MACCKPLAFERSLNYLLSERSRGILASQIEKSTMEQKTVDDTPAQVPPSAAGSLLAIARANAGRLGITFALVVVENGLFLAYPLFAGFAINAIIKGDALTAASYALVILGFWLVGALRRAVDTRTFTRIYAGLAVNVAMDQRTQLQSTSTVAARVVLSREFVDFFEKQMPLIATAIASMFGAVIMLLVIEPKIGVASCVALLCTLLWLPRFALRNEALHNRLNNRLEREVNLVGTVGKGTLLRHYTVLARLRVWLSDREAFAYLAIGAIAAALFLYATTSLAIGGNVQAGHIYAVMTYLWTFVTSIDEAPLLFDQFARLMDIGKRISAKQI